MTPEGRKGETQAQSEASTSRNVSAKVNKQPRFRGLQHNHHSQRARQHHSHMGGGQLDTVSATSLSSTCRPAQTWPTTADLLSVLHRLLYKWHPSVLADMHLSGEFKACLQSGQSSCSS